MGKIWEFQKKCLALCGFSIIFLNKSQYYFENNGTCICTVKMTTKIVLENNKKVQIKMCEMFIDDPKISKMEVVLLV